MDTADHPMDVTNPMDVPVPPPPPKPGEPDVTVEDPTADGYYCGARRTPQQIEQGGAESWPWCRNRAGKGTGNLGIGRCKNHGGASPRAKEASARLRLSLMVGPALGALARVLTDEDAPAGARVRAAEAILDRSGYPRRLDINHEDAREALVERIAALQASAEAES